MKNKILAIALILAIFHACTPSKNEKRTNSVTPIFLSAHGPKIPIDSLIEEINYIKLETQADNLIGLVSKILFTDKYILIADNVIANRTYLVDRNGHPL